MSEQNGGSAGIGEATCKALAKDGWQVVVAARRLERCERIAEEIGGGAKELDYLRDADDGDWEWMFETNVMGTMRVTRTLYPQLKASKGLVVNIGSVAGTDAYKGGSGYNAAKYGLRGATRAFRREEADFSLNRFNGDAERANEVSVLPQEEPRVVFFSSKSLTISSIASGCAASSSPATASSEFAIMPCTLRCSSLVPW